MGVFKSGKSNGSDETFRPLASWALFSVMGPEKCFGESPFLHNRSAHPDDELSLCGGVHISAVEGVDYSSCTCSSKAWQCHPAN